MNSKTIKQAAATSRLCQSRVCPGQTSGGHARPVAAPGSLLCGPCGSEVLSCLGELPRLYALCEEALARSPRPALDRPRSRRAAVLPINEAPSAARSAILATLAAWSGLVADEREVGRPRRRAVGDLAVYLLRNADWLLTHPAAADLAEEIAEVTRTARRAAEDQPDQRVRLGGCPHPGCRGTVSAAEAGRLRDLCCDAGHRWPPQQWLLLARQLNRGAGAA